MWLKNLMVGTVLGVVSVAAVADADSDYQQGSEAYRQDNLIGAMQLLERAVDAGHVDAMALLAYIHDKSQNDEVAIALYRRAIQLGSPAAELGLGQMYATGEGVEKDSGRALELIQGAAEKGYAPAMMRLSSAYAAAELGLEADAALASQWLNKAAEAGLDEAKAALLKRDEQAAAAEDGK